ncbi:hypothetical protein R2O95_14455, partial [Faecalibacterium duncaniae]|nr:hypothetical protein [Faecalibacterium duncaniae]
PSLFTDAACGRVLRVKGFVQDAAGWVELNATADGLTAAPIPAEYILASEAASAGRILLSRSQLATQAQRESAIDHLKRALAAC